MSDTRIGFGLYGAGLVAPFHAKALQASSKAKLVAVAGRSPDKVGKLTAEFGCRGYASLEEMLADPAVQVVNILTPNDLHFDAVIACAKAGRHVLVEKPPAVTLRETDAMAQACREAGVKLGVVLQCRVRQPIQAMKAAIAQGRFGRIYHADAFMKWYRAEDYYLMNPWRSSRRAGAGVTVQHAFHYIDLLQYLVGPVQRVTARMSNLAHPRVELEDTLLALVDYANGAQGVVEASTALWPGTDLRIEINGENGTAIMVGEHMEVWKFKEERPEDEGIRQLGDASQATGATGPAALGFQDHQVVIDDMVDAIREGRDPCIPVESVRPTLEWALAMYLSAKEGTAVTLPLVDEDAVW
ncbi:MAG: Gfo/Idh/MocA family oxidoreductase [Armatimonadetes bacterium]|jgi:UDP-N-acetyl-2-amino-2-deoxyglucuronate dehydrogenase|nr:Gfo/Idh/MocA family oxidoreductase [Armatimonadota bacterium]